MTWVRAIIVALRNLNESIVNDSSSWDRFEDETVMDPVPNSVYIEEASVTNPIIATVREDQS